MLSFVDSLKKVIADVQTTGGAAVERITPSSSLLQKLREHALQRIAETAKTKAPDWILIEWFTEGFFDEYVLACAIHLRKLGISDDDFVYRIIARVIEAQLGGWEHRDKGFEDGSAVSLNEIWEQMGDEQTLTYTFAQERWLIAWDYQPKTCVKLGEFYTNGSSF